MTTPTITEALAAYDRLPERDRRIVVETLLRHVLVCSSTVNWDALLHLTGPRSGGRASDVPEAFNGSYSPCFSWTDGRLDQGPGEYRVALLPNGLISDPGVVIQACKWRDLAVHHSVLAENQGVPA